MMFTGCCCPTCSIASDDFAVDNLATDWDVRSGSPTVSGGVLNFSAGTNLLIHNTAAGGAATGVYASVVFRVGGTTDTARLIIAYSSDSDYWFCEAQAGATNGTLKLFQRSGGVNTQRGTTQTVSSLQVSEDWVLSMCYNGTSVLASVGIGTGTAAEVVFNASVTVASTKAGIGGSEVSGVTFDDFAFEKHRVDDPTCKTCLTCDCCLTTMPDQMQIEFSGMTDFSCSDCDAFVGVYILQKQGRCSMRYDGATLCGGTVSILLGTNNTPNCTLRVTINHAVGSIVWSTAGYTDVDCLNLQNEALNVLSNAGAACNFSGVTARLTSL